MFGEKKDLLGRVWVDITKKEIEKESPLDKKMYKLTSSHHHHWYDLIFDAGANEGNILIGYDLIPYDFKDKFPLDLIDIQPKTN